MNKISFYIIGLLLLLTSACNREESTLTPSYADQDRVNDLLDLDRPVVKEFKEKWDINVLHQFDDTLDFKACLGNVNVINAWSYLNMTKLMDKQDIDYAYEKFDEMILAYMSPSIREHFMTKILLVDIAEYEDRNFPDISVEEPDVHDERTYTSFTNGYTYVFAFNRESMEQMSETMYENSRNSKLYCLITSIFKRHNIYAELPVNIYSAVREYYGLSINDYADEVFDDQRYDDDIHPLDTVYVGNERYYRPGWYIRNGFALTVNFPFNDSGKEISRRLAKFRTMSFPSFQDDINSMICFMIYGSKEEIEKYYLHAPVFIERFVLFLEYLQELGIDVVGINENMKLLLDRE